MGRELVDEKRLAGVLGLSDRTLQNWRWRGDGPVFQKVGGRVLYDLAEVDRWLDQCRRQSTSDPGPERDR